MKTAFIIFAACLAFAVQGRFADAAAPVTHAHCTGMTVTDSTASAAQSYADSDSSTWQNVTDANRSFTLSSAGCAVIGFSALASASNNNSGFQYIYLRMLVDGVPACAPTNTDTVFYSSVGGYEAGVTASTTRICEHLTAGPHTVQVQFFNDSVLGTDGTAQIDSPTLTVTHN